MFLFSGRGVTKLYEFINELRLYFGSNLRVINVIDNGQNRKLTNKHKDYKANRIVSKYDSSMMRNWKRNNPYKHKINRIFYIDRKFKYNLTFYYEGESDFKIGYILKWLHNKKINRKDILVCSFDKDLILSILLSCVLIKTIKNKNNIQYLFDDDVTELNRYMHNYIKCISFNNISDYFYWLVLYGDRVDNISKVAKNANELCDIFNDIYNKYNNISIDIIKKYYDNKIDLINKNCELVDIFNKNAFTHQQIMFMNKALNDFFNVR